jgi:hypothetical protein
MYFFNFSGEMSTNWKLEIGNLYIDFKINNTKI